MPIETEKIDIRRRSIEAEGNKEVKENEDSKELKAAASMERADLLVKEVKQSKQQMQNIVIHMQQVVQAIRQLRAQLQLAANNNDDPASIKQDKEMVEKLKKKIALYGAELQNMRGDLVREQMEELKNGIGVEMTSDQLQKKAEDLVEELLAVIKE